MYKQKLFQRKYLCSVLERGSVGLTSSIAQAATPVLYNTGCCFLASLLFHPAQNRKSSFMLQYRISC
jgi:hypothetical protein